jgi:hypothetical protein
VLDCDLRRLVDLLDHEIVLFAGHDAGDSHVLVTGRDDEALRVAPHLLVGRAGQIEPLQAVQVAALAHEADPEGLALAAKIEGVGNVLDPLVELPEQRLVPSDPLFARRHRCILSEFRLRGRWKTWGVRRSAERAAQNEARFREANEQIQGKVLELAAQEHPVPYLCECDDVGCTTVVLLTAAEYEDVRSGSRRFVVAPDHENPEDRVLGQHGGFTVIEKTGEEGRLVEELDPRG